MDIRPTYDCQAEDGPGPRKVVNGRDPVLIPADGAAFLAGFQKLFQKRIKIGPVLLFLIFATCSSVD